ncbi:MAG: hypothetical protein U9N45_03770, partial [Gemmatimonadota bacterium]|nr:hypothetical protein [Gemmatimonadota bacterium]
MYFLPGTAQGRIIPPLLLKTLLALLVAAQGPAAPDLHAAASTDDSPQSPDAAVCCDTIYPSPEKKAPLSLSSRFIVPGSLTVFSAGRPVPDSLFRLETVPGLFYPDSSLAGSVLVVSYRAWSFLTLPDSFSLRKSFHDSVKVTAVTPDP